MKYDLLVICAEKDYLKLQLCLERAIKYLNPNPSQIYVIAPNNLKIQGVNCVLDSEAIEIKKEEIKYRRPGWIFQQLVKLTQKFTEHDNYFCLDVDVFFNKPIQLITKDLKWNLFLTDIHQYHEPYFKLLKNEFDLERQIDNTFICDFMMMNKYIAEDMVPEKKDLLSLINNKVNDDYLIADYEWYGNYAYKHYPHLFNLQKIHAEQHGAFIDQSYSYQQILEILSKTSNDIDVVAIHTWT